MHLLKRHIHASAFADLLAVEYPAHRFRQEAGTIYIYRRGDGGQSPAVASVKVLTRGYAVQRGSDPPVTCADVAAAIAAVRAILDTR